MDYFYSAAMRRSRGALWPIFAPALIAPDQTNEVSLDVTNTGSVPGDAIAQIYIHQRYGSASRPERQLEGFKRVTLQPGQTKTLTFPLGKNELQFWDPQSRRWVVEPSEFDV